MKSIRRFLAILMILVFLAPAVSLSESGMQEIPEEDGLPQEEGVPEDWEAAEIEEEYRALGMWMAETEGTVKLFDAEENPLDLDEEMRFMGGTVLETEEESLAVVDMDRERLAIMDEISRAGFEKADNGSRISIALKSGAMYFRVGQPLEEEESFDVVMDDIRLAIRGTCGMVQQSEEGMSIILASGHAVIAREPEAGVEPGDGQDEETAGEPGEEPEEILIEAGETVSVSKEETGTGIRFEKRKLAEDEVPVFLTEALRKDPGQLEKVYAETGWQPEKLFGEDVPVWMIPAEEMDGVPAEWVGKTIGAGGWYNLCQYCRFPSERELIIGYIYAEGTDEMEYRLTAVRKYTPHYYGLCYERNGKTGEWGIAVPGITEGEILQLGECLRLAHLKDLWNYIRNSNRYAVTDEDGLLILGEDISTADVKGAKPFVDYQPHGMCHLMGDDQHRSALPDGLIGKKLVWKQPYKEEYFEFVSKDTMLNGYSEGIASDTLVHLEVISGPDHWYSISGAYAENEMAGRGLELIAPGITARELEYLREDFEWQTLVGMHRNMPDISVIDGNHYYCIFGDSVVQMEVR